MSFFSVIDARAIGLGAKPIALKVIQGNGVDVTPDLDIVVNRLNKGDKYFLNNGYGGITFKIDVIIHKDETTGNTASIVKKNWKYDDGKVLDYLQDWMSNMTPVYVVTEAIDIPNGRYIITKNSNRKQSFRNYTVWTLEFTQFKGLNIVKFKNNNKYIKKAKKNYAKAKAKAKKAKANNANKNKLKKCKISKMKYGVKKSNCVKYMQKVLYNKGYLKKKQIDGHFGKKTKGALKKFQKKYKKKYKLKVTGKVDKSTLKALIDA